MIFKDNVQCHGTNSIRIVGTLSVGDIHLEGMLPIAGFISRCNVGTVAIESEVASVISYELGLSKSITNT